MKVDLKGSVFVITGKLTKMNRREAEAAIRKAGGKTAKSVTKNTTYLFAGERPSSKYDKALNMGIPILTEDDFKALISGETVEVEEVGKAGDRSVDELLGEVRSVMQGTPTPQMWSKLVELLDACREEDVHVLTEYIDGYIARWTDDQMKGQTGTNQDVTDDTKRPYWWYYYRTGVEGELRVAPERWVGQMQQGVDSPKFKIVRGLELTDTKMTSTAIVNVLKHPALVNLQVLELPRSLAPSKTLVKALCNHPTLTHLQIGKLDEKTGPAFLEHGKEPGALETLDLTGLDVVYKLRGKEKVTEFIEAPYFGSVKSLHLSLRQRDKWVYERMTEDTEVLPVVEHIHLDNGYNTSEFIKTMLEGSWAVDNLRRLTANTLYYSPQNEANWCDLLHHDFAGHLDLLDLSGFSEARSRKEEDRDKLEAMLERELPQSRLLDHVDTLVLGEWKSKTLEKKLAKAFPDLTVQ